MSDRADPNNVTIELVHGGSVHVAHTMTEVGNKIWEAGKRPASIGSFAVFKRVTAFDSRQARGFPEVWLDVRHIVGIYPLTSRSDPPRPRHD